VIIEWSSIKRGRALVTNVGNYKSWYISSTKLLAVAREVGGVHSTHNVRDNKTLIREGTLL
jgi:hypothetical protein